MSGFSLSWLLSERAELVKDKFAFQSALSLLKARILESNDSSIGRVPLLHEWSGTRSCVGSLEMSVHAIERTIDEITSLIIKIQNGELKNSDDTFGEN